MFKITASGKRRGGGILLVGMGGAPAVVFLVATTLSTGPLGSPAARLRGAIANT